MEKNQQHRRRMGLTAALVVFLAFVSFAVIISPSGNILQDVSAQKSEMGDGCYHLSVGLACREPFDPDSSAP